MAHPGPLALHYDVQRQRTCVPRIVQEIRDKLVDYEKTKQILHILCQAMVDITGCNVQQIEELTCMGEYHLALDDISAPFFSKNIEMPHHLFVMFRDLALQMDTLKDPEYSGVAEFIARQGGKNPSPSS